MEPADVTQLFQVLEEMKELIEAVMSGAFILTGVLVGVMLMFIFFFFIKGAE